MSTEVAINKKTVKKILEESNGELVILQDFEQTKEELSKIAEKHQNLVITKENLTEGKEAVREMREARYAIQNITKHNKDFLNRAKSEIESQSEELINILKPLEDKGTEVIKTIENEKKLEKERKEQEEKERIVAINKKTADFKAFMEVKFQIGKTEEDLKLFDERMVDFTSKLSELQEFKFEGDELIAEFTEKRSEIVSRIEQQAELLKEQERLAAEKAEQEKKQAELKAEEDRLAAEKEKNDAKLKADQEALEKEKADFEAKKAKDKEASDEAERKLMISNRMLILEKEGYSLNEETGLFELKNENKELPVLIFKQDVLTVLNEVEFNEFLSAQKRSMDEKVKSIEHDKQREEQRQKDEAKRIATEQKISEKSKPLFLELTGKVEGLFESKLYDDKNETVRLAFEKFITNVQKQVEILKSDLYIK